MLYMLKFRKILLSNYTYLTLAVLVAFSLIIRLNLPARSSYNADSSVFVGIIKKITIDGSYLKLDLKAIDDIVISHYFKSEADRDAFATNFGLGDKVLVLGEIKEIKTLDLANTFNYKNYLDKAGISASIRADEIILMTKNKNPLYKLKNIVINKLNQRLNSKYLRAFIIGDMSLIDKNTKEAYQEIGINHLLAISGTHVSVISFAILYLMKKFKSKEIVSYLVTFIFLFIMLFLSSFAPAFLASCLFFLLRYLNKEFYFHITSLHLWVVNICVLLIFNKYLIYNIGFLYYSMISFYLLINSKDLENTKNSFCKLVKTSFLAHLAGVPLTIAINYSVNLMGVIYNIFYVPFISFIIFPLMIINIFIAPLDKPIKYLLSFMEGLAKYLDTLNTSLSFARLAMIIYLIYFLLIIIIVYKKKFIYLLLIILFIHSQIAIDGNNYIKFLDVGQGDATLVKYQGQYILIDTGGRESFNSESWTIRENDFDFGTDTLVPYLMGQGIKKIDYLFITHGDMDHIGGAYGLLDGLKVGHVYLNNNSFNANELLLIEKMKTKSVNYSVLSNQEELLLGELSIKNYGLDYDDDENMSSMVLNLRLRDISILLMGDAGTKAEKSLLGFKELENLDILKLGHHGSKTSSSEEFLSKVSANYAIVSAGKDNLFGHPNKEVMLRANNYSNYIYQTLIDGTISFSLENN